MAKSKLSTFSVQVHINLDTNVEIKAESFEQALELAKEYWVTDVIEIPNDHNDSEIKVTGIFKI